MLGSTSIALVLLCVLWHEAPRTRAFLLTVAACVAAFALATAQDPDRDVWIAAPFFCAAIALPMWSPEFVRARQHALCIASAIATTWILILG